MDLGVLADALEVDMQRAIRHRIELHVARQHAVLLAAELDVEQGA